MRRTIIIAISIMSLILPFVLGAWLDSNTYNININNEYDYDLGVDFSDPNLYYVIIEADSISSISNFQVVTDVYMQNIASKKWILYSASTSGYEISRAKVMKTLFYGTAGTDPRVTSTYITNIQALKSNDPRDIGRRAYYIKHQGGGSSSSGYRTCTFNSTLNNYNVSLWGQAKITYMCYQSYIQMPAGTTKISQARSCDGSGVSVSNDDTEIASYMVNNPPDLRNGGSTGSYSSTGWDSVSFILTKNEITGCVNTGSTSSSTHTDFYTTHGVPFITPIDHKDIYSINSASSSDTLDVNMAYTGTYITINTPDVLELNDSSMGTNLQNGSCYDLTINTLNWTVLANVTFGSDYRDLVTYDFVNYCPKPAVINSVRISPNSSVPVATTLKGYCKGTDPNSLLLKYCYKWYLDGSEYSSACQGGFNVGGSEVNLNDVSSLNVYKNQNWTFSCMAQNMDLVNSTWTNSTTLKTINTAPSITSGSIQTTLYTDTLVNCSANGVVDPDNDILIYTYSWYKNGALLPSETNQILNLSKTGNGDKGESVYCKQYAFDGENNSNEVQSSSIMILNKAPELNKIANINVSLPKPTEQILCYNFTYYDADGDTQSGINYNWYKNSVQISGQTSNTLDLSALSGLNKGDNITCGVSVSDGFVFSSIYQSTQAQIGNTAPTLSAAPTINNTAPISKDIIKCNYNYYDADGDTINTAYFKWNLNNITEAGQTSQTLNISQTSANKGTNITCEVKVNDGEDNSTWYESSQVVVGNGQPTLTGLPGVDISELNQNKLSCVNISYYDPDGDSLNTVTYRWWDDSGLISGESGQNITLKGTWFNKNDNVTCEIKVNDGTADSAWFESPYIIISNAVSLPVNVNFGNESIDRSMNLTCSYTLNDIDSDGVNLTFYKWYKNNIAINGITTQNVILSSLSLNIGDNLSCGISLYDGVVSSDYIKSNNTIISNHHPTFNITLDPTNASLGDDLNCSVVVPTDVDGDDFNYTMKWYHGTTLLTSQNNSPINYLVLDSSNTASNEIYTCNVTQIEYGTEANQINKKKDLPIGNVPPELQSITIPDLLFDSIVPITLSAFDLNGDTLTYTCGYKLDTTTNYTYLDPVSTTTISWDATSLADGDYNVKCYAEDQGTTSNFMEYSKSIKIKHLTVANIPSDKGIFLTKYTVYAPYTFEDNQYSSGLDSQMIGDDLNNNVLSAIFYTQEKTTKIKSFSIKPFHQYKNDASQSTGITDPIYSLQLLKVSNIGDISGTTIWRKDGEAFTIGYENSYTINMDVDNSFYAMKVCIVDTITGLCTYKNSGKIDAILLYSSNTPSTYKFKTLTNSIAYEKYNPNIIFSYQRDSYSQTLTKIDNPFESSGFVPSLIRRENEATNLCGGELALKLGLPSCITEVNGEYYFESPDSLELGQTNSYYVIYSKKNNFAQNATASTSFTKGTDIDSNLKLNVYGTNANNVNVVLNSQSIVSSQLVNALISSQTLNNVLTSTNSLSISGTGGTVYYYFEPQFSDLEINGLPTDIEPVENGYRRTKINLITSRNIDLTASSCKITRYDNPSFLIQSSITAVSSNNYTCSFDMQYYHLPGTYTFTATTLENGIPNIVEDTFNYGDTKALTVSTLTFESTDYSESDQYIIDSFTIKNTGNVNITNVTWNYGEDYYWNLDVDDSYFKIKGNTWFAYNDEENLEKTRYKYDFTDGIQLYDVLGVGETKTIYVKLKIPAKQDVGEYDTELDVNWE